MSDAGLPPGAAAPTDWLVWSYEHDAWWKPGRHGYTPALAEAGLYTEAEAKEIERQANEHARGGLVISERAVPVQEEIGKLSRILAASREGGNQPDEECEGCGKPKADHQGAGLFCPLYRDYPRTSTFRSRERAAALPPTDRDAVLEEARQAVDKRLSYGPDPMRRHEAGDLAARAINDLREGEHT